MNNQPTVREINNHVFAGTGVCMVYAGTWQMRISRARTREGVKEGRIVCGTAPSKDRWVAIPKDAIIELM